jgi:hypothetical protein
MRCTYGTAAALAAGLLIMTAFWPSTSQGPVPARAVAQNVPTGGVAGGLPPGIGAAAGVADNDQRVEAALAKRLPQVLFEEVSLEDVIRNLEEKLEIDILIDRQTLADENVALDQAVSLKVTRTQLTGRAALELVLEPLQLGFVVRDGLVIVTTGVKIGESLDVQVYNVRDLIAFGAQGGAGVYTSSIDQRSPIAFASVESLIAPLATAEVSQPGPGMAGGGAGGGAGGMMPPGMEGAGGFGGMGGGGTVHQTNSLAQLIAITVDPDSWSDVGGPGSIVQYGDGLLVAKNTQKVHGKIRQLLTMLRESNREQGPGAAGGGVYIPSTSSQGGPPPENPAGLPGAAPGGAARVGF